MKMKILLIILLVFSSLYSVEKQPVDYVDTFLGTSSSRWMLYPGPSMPFGMVKLSPDNTDEWMMDAGYEYLIESISGFGFIHSWEMSSFLTMPTTGKVKIKPGLKDNPDAGYRSRISHSEEEASPGYYSVYLNDYGIKAELTATTRTGVQRYTFPKTKDAHILFDLVVPSENTSTIIAASIQKVSDSEIAGFAKHKSGWNEYTIHFVSKFSKQFKSITGWKDEEVATDIDEISTEKNIDIGALVKFSTEDDQVIIMKTGISYVSIEQARINLEMETGRFGWDFDAVHQYARQTWNNLLQKIKVEGGAETDKIKFYTGMYRSYCSRTIFSDANGKYVDMCEKIQQLKDPNSPVYGSDAFWNTFWNLNQLWSLITPDITNKWVNSLLEIYDRGGWLSKGPGGIEYSSIMVASHEISLIVSAYQKGIRNFDINKAYRAIREIQTIPGELYECGGYVGNHNLRSYMEMGFVPREKGPVSNTLEYAYDDWCVAQMAKSLGKSNDYKYFVSRSQFYKNVFDPSTGFFRAKHIGGPWLKHFVPVVKAVGKEDNFGGRDYIEGNAWQYSFFVPHNVKGLTDLIGIDEFNRRLNDGFELSKPNFVSQFVNHSNQPNMQAGWLFNYSGKPWLTQKWVREILDNYYGTGPVNGYPGDEDQGQMGAWYVMSAMGLFEIDGGASTEPVYEIASPLFEKITIQLDDKYYSGKKFTILAKNSSKKNRYIKSAVLNGKPLNKFWFDHYALTGGGELVLKMGPEPNKDWAAESPTPQINDDVKAIVTTPYTTSDNKIFLDKAEVSLACDTDGSDIYYTLDGSQPTINSKLYVSPFSIKETTKIKMRAFVGDHASLPAFAVFKKAELAHSIDPGNLEQGVSYNYYVGSFNNVNDYSNIKPYKSGVVSKIDLDKKDREQYFAFDFKGYINIPIDGLFTFYLISNDGSKLFIDNNVVINIDGLHPAIEEFKTLALKAGKHAIAIKYFQGGGSNMLKFMWEGPGLEKQEVTASLLFHKKD